MTAAARSGLGTMILLHHGDPSAHVSLRRRPRWPVRMRLPAAAALVGLLLAMVSCATASHGYETVRGHQVVLIIPDAEDVSRVFPDIQNGTPVIVRDGQGHRIGSGKLAFNDKTSGYDNNVFNSDPENGGNFAAVFDFTVRVPVGLPRYGIAVGTGHGVAWFNADRMRAGPVLTLGSLSLDTGGGPLSCPAPAQPELVRRGLCVDAAGGYQYMPRR
jgi:hypothetical protein